MAKQIFVNLPVKGLNKSIDFFTKLGFSFNPQFTDEKAGCMVISDNIFAMLLTEQFFRTFTNKKSRTRGKVPRSCLESTPTARKRLTRW